jgi:FkbM family methyltransferase
MGSVLAFVSDSFDCSPLRVDLCALSGPIFSFQGTVMMISYAQYGEDVVLDRVFGEQPTGFYVDIGAGDPVVDSVTQHFYLKGWIGINVEPSVEPFERLARARARDINLNLAVSDREGVQLFYHLPLKPGLSTFNSELAAMYRAEGDSLVEKRIRTVPLRRICQTHIRQAIDFMKIDVEGHEREVLIGTDWRRWRPRVLVIEAGWHAEQWEPILLDAGYLRGPLRDNCNHFYVREEDRDWLQLLQLPANVKDNFIRYDLHRALETSQEWQTMGPVITNIAKALNRFKCRHPRVVSLAKAAHAFCRPNTSRP